MIVELTCCADPRDVLVLEPEHGPDGEPAVGVQMNHSGSLGRYVLLDAPSARAMRVFLEHWLRENGEES